MIDNNFARPEWSVSAISYALKDEDDHLTNGSPDPVDAADGFHPGEVTQLLNEWRDGKRDSLDRLMAALYLDLKRMAAKTGAEPDDTMQATVIVNEFYLRLLGQSRPCYENREHFFSLAARVMRQIRIDYARRNGALKRGGNVALISLEHDAAAISQDTEVEALHDALAKLETFDKRKAAMLDLRYFVGLTVQEVASAFELSTETVRKDMRLAEAWLVSHLGPAAAL